MTLTNGQLLARRYRLGRRIAIGGMGEVWEAADTRLERQVAVKVLKPELSGDAEFRSRFHAEARMTASLNHPGIAAVHDYGETAVEPSKAGADPDIAYLVMELVFGDPLAAILARQPRLGTDRTLDLLGQAADALQAAHQRGLVHRDIKPGNILVTAAGTVKLTDFGIARAVDAAPVTRQGMVLGTAHYIAPEQAAGHDCGPASDVYSLAVVGYECLAGRRLFHADNAVTVAMMHIRDQPPPLPPDVPAEVRALIEAALVKDPRQRYGTGGEFSAAIAAVRAGHRLPLAVTRTAPMTAGNPAPTALLPLGGMSGPVDRPGTGPHLVPGRLRRIALALCGVLALILAFYLVNEARQAGDASPADSAGDTSTVPAAPGRAQPVPAEQRPRRESGDAGRGLLPGVLIVPTDYWGERASDAAVTAKSRGLVPLVVDEDGAQVDRDRRSQCRVTGIRPLAGLVPPGSTLELTCRSAR
ncbi:MAG: serine/threonine-protein kinase [Pseudonocardiaceae bacterium]